jgi:hypothetical protein
MVTRGLLIAGLILTGMIFATNAYAATTGSATQTVDATPEPTLVLTVPAGVNFGQIPVGAAGKEISAGIVNVKSNDVFDLEIKADISIMKEYCPGSPTCTSLCSGSEAAGYVAASPDTLTEALQWKGGDQAAYIDIATVDGAKVRDNAGFTTDAGLDTEIFLKQVVHYDDEVLTTGNEHTYRLVITYTATQNL